MKSYIVRRLMWSIVAAIGASLILFTILRVIPGDVATLILVGDQEARVTQKQIDDLKKQLGLDKSLPIQYTSWLWDTVRLDLGNSLYTRIPVTTELKNRFPPTLQLTIMAIIISLGITLPAGIFAAVWHNRAGDYVIRSLAIAGLAAPSFWVALLLILFLIRQFHWSPPLGYVNVWDSPSHNMQMMIWPAIVLGFSSAAVKTRMLRSSLLEVLRQDYIRTAWSKGLAGRPVLVNHALKNALLPVVTLIGLQVAGLIGGVVIMEKIFSIPGLGSGLFDAIVARDYPMVQSLIFLLTLAVILVNLLTDLVYGWLDPRIRYT